MSLLHLPKVIDKTNVSISTERWRVVKEDPHSIYLVPVEKINGIIIKVDRSSEGENLLKFNDHSPGGRFIEKKRMSLGLSQHDLAKKSCVSQMTISNVENGTCNQVSSTTLDKLLDALGENIDIFYNTFFPV